MKINVFSWAKVSVKIFIADAEVCVRKLFYNNVKFLQFLQHSSIAHLTSHFTCCFLLHSLGQNSSPSFVQPTDSICSLGPVLRLLSSYFSQYVYIL